MLLKWLKIITASLSGRMTLALLLMLIAGLMISTMYLNQTIGDLRRSLVHVEAHRLVDGVTADKGLSTLPLWQQTTGDVQYTLYSPDGELLWYSQNLERPRRFKPSVLSTSWYSLLFNRIGHVLNVPVGLNDGNIMMVSLNDSHFRAILEPLINQRISRTLWLMLPLSLLLSIILVPLLVRWTLRSVNHASAVAGNIHPHGDIKHIPTEALPSEIQPLAVAANTALEKLDNAYQAERQFVADAAHSLRTPLTVLALQFENVAHGKSQDLSLIHTELARLQQLVSQLLQLARLEHNGDGSAGIQQTQMSRCIRQVINLLLPRFDKQQRTLNLHIPAEAEYQVCLGSSYLFHEVLTNLLENALMHGEGDVNVEVSVTTDTMAISITDQGTQLTDDSLDTLCARFYKRQIDSSGSGLGLAIVNAILPHIHGTLTLHSSPQTRFTLSFLLSNIPFQQKIIF